MFEALDYCNRLKTRSSSNKLDDARIELEEAYVKELERCDQGNTDKIKTTAEH